MAFAHRHTLAKHVKREHSNATTATTTAASAGPSEGGCRAKPESVDSGDSVPAKRTRRSVSASAGREVDRSADRPVDIPVD